MTQQILKLPNNPTLQDFQKYVKTMEEIRGFEDESILQKALLFVEEIGELFKAIRKIEGMKVDRQNSKFSEISDEMADVFIYLLALANKYNIDLETAFRKKEEKNKKRHWTT